MEYNREFLKQIIISSLSKFSDNQINLSSSSSLDLLSEEITNNFFSRRLEIINCLDQKSGFLNK